MNQSKLGRPQSEKLGDIGYKLIITIVCSVPTVIVNDILSADRRGCANHPR